MRVRLRPLLLTGLLVCARGAWALYEPEKLPDTTRRWAVNASFTAGFDDNINTTSSNQQSGVHAGVSAGVQASVPMEQTFFRMRYTYGTSYTSDRVNGGTEQSHSFDGLLSHTFSPRLVANLSDTLRRGVEPDAVEVTSAQNVQLQRRGDYLFNSAAVDANYNLSRRLTATVRGGWELWRYDVSNLASNSDRDTYSGGAEFSYQLAPRTFAGMGYQYSVSSYSNPGSNDTRNSTTHSVYAAASRVFTPHLSANLQVGVERREYTDSTAVGPTVATAVNYNYSQDASATLGFRYSMTATEVDAFRNTDSATVYVQGNYRLAQRLTASAKAVASRATFKNPLPGVTGIGNIKSELDFGAGLGLSYHFVRWCTGSLAYDYDHVESDVAARTFSRNRVSLVVDLSY